MSVILFGFSVDCLLSAKQRCRAVNTKNRAQN